MRHDRSVGITFSADVVTEISVVENPARDRQNRPNENVVQLSRAEPHPTSAAMDGIPWECGSEVENKVVTLRLLCAHLFSQSCKGTSISAPITSVHN